MEGTSLHTGARGVLTSDGTDRTRAIGRGLGERARPGTVVALIGELGAGKTQMAKGIAEGLGVRNVVNSPTFVLMNEHVGRLRLYHVDAYRLEDAEEALAAGLLDERQADGVTVIEWADRLAGWLPAARLDIEIDVLPDGPDLRRVRWLARGADHEALADEALNRS